MGVSTTRLGLYRPFGTLVGTGNSAGTTTTFHTTNAGNTLLNIGDKVKIYAVASGLHTVRGATVTITNKQIDTPGAGTTRFTFTPALSTSTASGDECYNLEIVDVTSWIADNMTKADGVLGAYPCTSSTRPTGAARFTDMVIKESDTKEIRRWTGASWELISHPRRARGRMGYSSSNTAGAAISAGSQSTAYIPVTFNAKAGQWYKVFASVNIAYASGTDGECWLVIRRATGGTVAGSDTEVSRVCGDSMSDVSASHNNRAIGAFQVSSDQQVTVGLFLDRTGMTDTSTLQFVANSFNMMCVEDMGQ